MRIADRTFIVSGGSSGLGLATVADLLTSDAYVSIVDLKPPNDLELQSSSHIKFFQTDVSNVNEIEKAVDGTVAWTKGTGAALGGVINCAGVGTVGKIIDSNNNPLSLDLWDFTLAVNLTGTFNLTRLALKHLVTVPPEGPDGERGIIILVASSVAFEGQPGQVAYAASKGALASMTLPMSRDLARHAIRIVTIAPGAFSTAMTAQLPEKAMRSFEGNGGLVYPQRFGNPDEFAKTVRWAIEVPYVNGEVVRLSGAGRLPGKL